MAQQVVLLPHRIPELWLLSLHDQFFYKFSGFHPSYQNMQSGGQNKLPLGVNECVKVCMHGAVS